MARRSAVTAFGSFVALSLCGCLLSAASQPAAREEAPADSASGEEQIPCLPLGCDEVSEWPTGLPEPGAFEPDRRPIFGVSLWLNGKWYDEDDDGRLGNSGLQAEYHNNGRMDALDFLIGILDEAHALGWRRMLIWLPAGQLDGQPLMPSSQWWPMSEEKREQIKRHLGEWIRAHPETSVGVYSGYRIADPCSLCMTPERVEQCAGRERARHPDPSSEADRCVVYHNVKPWMDVGVKEYWFDAAVDWRNFLRLTQNPDFEGLRIGGEPIPKSGPKSPDFELLNRAPYMATKTYWHNNVRMPNGNISLNPKLTEVHYIYGRSWISRMSGRELLQHVATAHRSGFIPLTVTRRASEAIRRVMGSTPETPFDMSKVRLPADLNMDGVVDAKDRAWLLGNWGKKNATLYHGDLNGDGTVNRADNELLSQSWGKRARVGFGPGPVGSGRSKGKINVVGVK